MKLTGRLLILLCLSTCGCVSEMAEMVDGARVQARIGVMANTEVEWITGTKTLEGALRFYKASKVDAVVITGKTTKDGYKAQFAVLDQVWKKVFGGTDVQLITRDGEYVVKGFDFAVSAAKPIGTRRLLTFHGGEKRALTDELCYYPREANVVCAGSMSGLDIPAGFVGGRSKSHRVDNVCQGLLVSVYSDHKVIRRLDFAPRGGTVLDVADPWKVGERLGVERAPEFWDDTRIQVLPGQVGENRVYTVKWPNVKKCFTGARARYYEVEAAYATRLNYPFMRKSVLSDGFYLPEDCDAAGVKCVFPVNDLPACDASDKMVVFGVTPIGTFGKRGKTFRSEPVPLPVR